MKSGKYTLGYKSTLKTLRQGKAKLVIISNNTPQLRYLNPIFMPFTRHLHFSDIKFTDTFKDTLCFKYCYEQGHREPERAFGHNFGVGPSDMFSSNGIIMKWIH